VTRSARITEERAAELAEDALLKVARGRPLPAVHALLAGVLSRSCRIESTSRRARRTWARRFRN
jgi:hypothetical protein